MTARFVERDAIKMTHYPATNPQVWNSTSQRHFEAADRRGRDQRQAVHQVWP